MNISSMLNVPTVTINGREYYHSAGPVYPLPMDWAESQRLDFLNIAIYFREPAQLHRSRLTRPNGHARVLDVGTGTGWWANRLGELNEQAYRVIGIDTVVHWPRNQGREPNVTFLQVDFVASDNWLVEPASFQLVHAAMLCGCIPDYPVFYSRLYKHVAPGGFCELIEIDWQPRCDDPSRPPQDAAAFREFWENLTQATHLSGRPITYRDDTASLLEAAGFQNLTHDTLRISLLHQGGHSDVPLSSAAAYAPPGPEAQRSHIAENDFRLAMGYPGAWSAMCMELFTRYRGWTPADVEYLDQRLVAAVNHRSPFYFHVHIWTAQRAHVQLPHTRSKQMR